LLNVAWRREMRREKKRKREREGDNEVSFLRKVKETAIHSLSPT
jgi:hypothetical protein